MGLLALHIRLHANVCSWLNAVKLLRKTHQAAIEALKRGVFVSVVDLQAAINRFVVEHNNTTPSRSHSLGPLIRQNHRAADAGTKC